MAYKVPNISSSRSKIIAMVLIGAGLLVLGVAAWVLMPKPEAVAEYSIGREYSAIPAEVEFPAPELILTDLNNNPVALSDYLGQLVLVNNWATWCPPCTAEMPGLQDYYDLHQHQNFTIIAIEAGDPVSEVSDFVDRYGLTFPIWLDPEQESINTFRNTSLPNSYVIDRGGLVRLAWVGAISQEVLEEYVTPLLEE
jgi:peroxiredoxin